jgi:two-component system, NtrC family, sensor kinase
MIRVRHKLILLGALVILVVSSAFTLINLALARRAIEEDLKTRAIIYASEIAGTFGDRQELERGAIDQAIGRLLRIRKSALQLDVLTFAGDGPRLVASSHRHAPLEVSAADAAAVRGGRAVARAAQTHWEVIAPIALDGAVDTVVVGAVAVRFSSQRAEELASRIRFWALTLSAASVVLMALLMSATIHLVVDRPIRRFMDAIARAADGGPPGVDVKTSDEFGVLAAQFNAMVSRISRFNDELRTRVAEATDELDRRYHQVQQLNALLFEMQRRLSHAERLALSGRVMAEVAHEVGTPLHSVAGHLELLRRDLPAALLTEDTVRRLAIIETQLNRVTEIIARLLDSTRRVPTEPGAVDVCALARDTAELVRPALARDGVSLTVTTTPGLPPVRGQHDPLQQVILNLLTNAMAATPRGGAISVATRALADEDEVEIAVSDTGHGIPRESREQIFEPFFSTKEPGRGTGLGLFISAEIVREHKGRIEVDSEPGRGTTFRVILPAAAVVS